MNGIAAGGVGPYHGDTKMDAEARPATTRERLEQLDKVAQERAADVREAKRILDAHPDLEKLLDVLRRIGV